MADRQLRSVQILRGIAATGVVLTHLVAVERKYLPGTPLTSHGLEIGAGGVDLFFVISGFVITRSLAQERATTGRVSLAGFYLRRVRRILPAAALVVAVILLTRRSEVWTAVAVLTSSYNWFLAFGAPRTSDLVHTWSLAVEEQFYLLWPLAFALLSRRGARTTRWALGAAIAASIAWMLLLAAGSAPWQRTYFGSDIRAQAILAGCLLAVYATTSIPKGPLRLWAVPAAMLAGMALLVDNHSPVMAFGGLTVAAAASAWLVAAAVEEPEALPARFLSTAPMQWLGLRSYSLFLWHYPIAQALARLTPAWWLPLAAAASLGFAELSYRFVERPFLRRRGNAAAEAQAAP